MVTKLAKTRDVEIGVEIKLGQLLHNRICHLEHADMCGLLYSNAWKLEGLWHRQKNEYWLMACRILRVARKRNLQIEDVNAIIRCL